ncbi:MULTISPECIES: hypothetical protein [unclassified Streptomyces]|uniref:hypothetical protein n=1 Tax=unclassified Streptomyces TaxID=2593676 RepID=UPI001489346C|nr:MULTISPECIES: hypothetical protein [unclassified Streptomyces]
MTLPISAVDVPAAEVETAMRRELARQKFAARMARLPDLLAHPERAAQGEPAKAGYLAEMRHLLYDADADATTPAFPYPTAEEAS